MAINPLQQYFRQPKIFVSLPSKGAYMPPATVAGDITSVAVQGMTGMDEIILKTPDALFTGEATIKMLQSCCPTIKNAWDLSSIDTNILFVAVRIATYGNTMTVHHKCSACNELCDYELDLTTIIEHFNKCSYDDTLHYKDLTIKIKPISYRQQTDYNMQVYDLQKQVYQTSELTDDADKQKNLNILWEALAKLQLELNANSVESIETPSATVTERGFILEFLANTDKELITAISNLVDKNRTDWQVPIFPVTCTNDACKTETNLSVELDNSNFFVSA
jgi:L-lactate utilization protein LutB